MCLKCQRVMEKKMELLEDLSRLKKLEKHVSAVSKPVRFAKFIFSIVPHGWQCDVEIQVKGGNIARGSVCRDWGDSGPTAKRFINKLYEMGRSGKP